MTSFARKCLTRFRASLVLFACLFAITSTRAVLAVNYVYIGGNGAFHNPVNWTPSGGPPDNSTDVALFTLSNTYLVDFFWPGHGTESGDETNLRFEVARGTVTFDLGTDCSQFGCSPVNGAPVTYTLSATSGGAAVIGTTSGPLATLIATRAPDREAAGEFSASSFLQIGRDFGSHGRFVLDDTDWIGNANQAYVGYEGQGELEIENGSTVHNSNGYIGFAAGSIGAVTVSAGTWDNQSSLYVGYNGHGELEIENGSNVHNAVGYVGFDAGSTGAVTVTDGTWDNQGSLYLGGNAAQAGGTGSLVVNGADAIVNVAGTLRVWPGGSLTLTNGEMDITGPLIVRNGSTVQMNGGTLTTGGGVNIQNGATVPLNGGILNAATLIGSANSLVWTAGKLNITAGDLAIDSSAPLGANVQISGNKDLSVSGALRIGETAGGTLTVLAGRTVASDSGMVGSALPGSTQSNVSLSGIAAAWTMTGDLTARGLNGARVSVNSGAQLTNQNAFVANAAGTTADIDVDGANTKWINQGSAYLGGDATSAGGSGTLDITAGAKMTVASLLKVWQPFAVTLNDGTLETANLDVLGTINVLGSSTLQATGNVTISGGATVNGPLTGNALTSVTVSSAGTTWTMPGSLEVATSSAGVGRIGTLSLQGGTTSVAGDVTVLDATKFTLAGGTLNAASVELGNADFSGFGAINANFHTSGSVTAAGALTIGNANSPVGAVIGGTLNVGSHTVTINKKGFYLLGNSSHVTGGTLIVPGGVAIPVGNTFEARGIVDARVVAQSGSLIEATGDLALGATSLPAGFFSDGELTIGAATVTIHDANEAVLGSLTTLGLANGRPGLLVVGNGAVLDFGKNIVGVGIVETPDDPTRPLINNGTIWGQSADDPIKLAGHVKGVGRYDHVVFAGTFSPGFSPATAYLGSAVYGANATLVIELGSTTPGSGHDQLVHSGTASFGGTLDVDLLGGFVPSDGDMFTIATYVSRIGQFTTLDLPPLAAGLMWSLTYNPNSFILSTTTESLLPGDIDLDGDVDRTDAGLFSQYFGHETSSIWTTGDFNADGATTLADWGLLQTHLGQSVAPSAAAVPEPSTFSLVALAPIAVAFTFRSRAKL